MLTISALGGMWFDGNQVGVALRNLYNTLANTSDGIASRQKITGLTHLSAMPVYFKKFV
jgi:hypothetical protein